MPAQTSAQAIKQIQSYQKGVKDPIQLLTSQEQKLGAPAAQQQVSGLRQAINSTTNLLKQVAPGVMGRVGNSLVTNAQANRIIQNEQAPIAENLNQQTTDFNTANTDLDRILGRADSRTALAMQGQQGKMSYLQSVYDALFGKEQARESKRQFNAQLAAQERESRRAAAASGGGGFGDILGSLGLGGGGAGGGNAKVNTRALATSLAKVAKSKAFTQGNTQPFYREAVLKNIIKTLKSQGVNISSKNKFLQNLIYKKIFPDNWASSGAFASKPVASNKSNSAKFLESIAAN